MCAKRQIIIVPSNAPEASTPASWAATRKLILHAVIVPSHIHAGMLHSSNQPTQRKSKSTAMKFDCMPQLASRNATSACKGDQIRSVHRGQTRQGAGKFVIANIHQLNLAKAVWRAPCIRQCALKLIAPCTPSCCSEQIRHASVMSTAQRAHNLCSR